uniref:Serine-threonine/tyrosine-protein kinase catalytic domain-containing protein n=1 Tax=Globisporangium ultimum (strain ATCC 200006 / CBS 805.95 / DAOM BR144) TaxID=431595 RepID=K3WKN8_GLOUD
MGCASSKPVDKVIDPNQQSSRTNPYVPVNPQEGATRPPRGPNPDPVRSTTESKPAPTTKPVPTNRTRPDNNTVDFQEFKDDEKNILDTRKIPYHDIKAKGARNKKVSGSTLMHMVAYDNLRPSLSPNCMDSVRDLYNRCTADDQSQRPTFEEIVQVLENNVRKETLMRANEQRVEVPQSEQDVSPEELGVFHATNYLD